MAESPQHARLVRLILEYVEQEFKDLEWLAVYDDAAEPMRGEKPPRVGGYVPDVFAVDTPRSTTIIGEAKTLLDLETQHSRQQITSFLQHLTLARNGVFILATPISAAGLARNIVAASCRELPSIPRVIYLNGNPS